MKLSILAILLCVFMSGCVSSQIMPTQSALSSIRTIAVVPIEVMPLILHPDNEDDRKAIDAVARSSNSPDLARARSVNGPAAPLSESAAPLINAPIKSIRTGASILAIVGGTAKLVEAASAGQELPGETAVIEMGQPSEIWTPSVEYAKTVGKTLREKGSREIHTIHGYIKLPIADRSITWHMEHWLGPTRRLYNGETSTVDYTTIGPNRDDAILEVGVLNYEYYSERLLLQVFVRLIDARTKQVLGRARNFSTSKTGPLAPLIENDAGGMKRLILETGNRLLGKCLSEIGLASE